jgi:hypothetical protein
MALPPHGLFSDAWATARQCRLWPGYGALAEHLVADLVSMTAGSPTLAG